MAGTLNCIEFTSVPIAARLSCRQSELTTLINDEFIGLPPLGTRQLICLNIDMVKRHAVLACPCLATRGREIPWTDGLKTKGSWEFKNLGMKKTD